MRFKIAQRLTLLAGLLFTSGPALATDLTVSAASSLTNAFEQIAHRYEAYHPRTRILLNFAGSGTLLQQIAKGAPVDVFASADQHTMDLAAEQQLIDPGSRRDFAGNSLVLIVPADSPYTPSRLEDLTRPEIQRIAIAIPASVPVGRYTRAALEAADLWPAISAKAIPTQNVRQSLDYVARGEVDAGFVYATDAAIRSDKVKRAFEVPLTDSIRYPIARVAASDQADEAKRFIEFVLSPAGQRILGEHGFGTP